MYQKVPESVLIGTGKSIKTNLKIDVNIMNYILGSGKSIC